MAESIRAAKVQSDLKPGALGLVGVTMQAITHIAPAIAALFFTQFLVTLAGVTAPLAYVAAVWCVHRLGRAVGLSSGWSAAMLWEAGNSSRRLSCACLRPSV